MHSTATPTQSKKRRVYEIIQISGGSDAAGRAFDRCIIFLIILSIVITTAQTFRLPETVRRLLDVLDAVCMITFTVEYALRLWTADLLYPASKAPYLKFLVSLSGLIDLFSFLPFYLAELVPAGLVVFRLIRVARILRLFRINPYLDPVSAILSVLRKKATLIFASLFMVFILMFSASLLMYYVEHDAQPTVFENAFSGLWWAVSTLSTTGYGDIYPVTFLGKTLAIIITLLGMCIVAVPTGIITAGFMEAARYADPVSRGMEETLSLSGRLLDISTGRTKVFAPSLVDPENSYIEQLPLSCFVGPCIVETVNGEVSAEKIGAIISRSSGEASQRILLRGNACLTTEAAQFLSRFNAFLIGFGQGIPETGSASFFPEDGTEKISRILLAGHVTLLTGLDLSCIDDGEYLINASPVLIQGASSAPCRAYLTRSVYTAG